MAKEEFQLKQRKFQLVVWEETEEFRVMSEEAEQRRKELVRAWIEKYSGDSYVGSIEPNRDRDGELIFWINDFGCFHTGRFYGQGRKWSSEEALKNALKYGNGGWCTLDELEQLIEGKGPLLKRAMQDCGFRQHKKISEKWARITSKDKKEMGKKRIEFYQKKEERRWPPTEGAELERLDQLWVLPNHWVGLNRTYNIQTNNKGLIYVRLEVNPFSATRIEDLSWFGAMLRNCGHINREQRGFYIDARNVKLGEEKGVHIKAVKPNGTYAECIWPNQTPHEKIYDLANDLVSRVKEPSR